MDINGFEIDQFNIYGIKAGATTSTCPKCSADRKYNPKQKCLSVFWDSGIGKCNHCGETLQLHTFKKKVSVVNYKRPVFVPLSRPYSDKFTNYLCNTRKISLNALESLKIREVKEWMPQTQKEENCIAFDYFYDSELYNTKFRDGSKNFKLVKDAEKILYNLDSIKNSKYVIFVEGEMDVLSWVTAGKKACVSVPNGFTKTGKVNLDYIDNYIHLFDALDWIYVGVDNDEAGRNGKDELIRRFGIDKIKVIEYQGLKDANECLIKAGVETLLACFDNAKEIQIDGVFTANQSKQAILDLYRNGQKRGTTTYFPKIDRAWTWREGETNIWTGYQNEGKTLFFLQLCLIRAIKEGVKVAVFSPENMPKTDFFNDLIESLIGKSVDPYYKNNYMSEDELNFAIDVIDKYFFLIHPDNDFTLDTILEKASFLVKKNGIRTLLIDPYNTIDHHQDKGGREDLYISKFMSQLKKFAVEKDVSVNLIAHQNTPRPNDKDEGRYFKPNLNNIKGGGTFADKADNVLIVWRHNRAIDFKDAQVTFESQKIKKQKLVGIPNLVDDIIFDIRKQRYFIDNSSPLEEIDQLFTPSKNQIRESDQIIDLDSGQVFSSNPLDLAAKRIQQEELTGDTPPF